MTTSTGQSTVPIPNPLPKFVFRQAQRGRVYLYFRHQGLYTRLPDDPASTEFAIRYGQLLESISKPSAKRLPPGSVRALIAEFKSTPEYTKLEPKTRLGYARSLDKLALAVGEFKATRIKRHHIVRIRNALASPAPTEDGKPARAKPRAADDFVAAVSRMFTIGLDLGYCETNPAARIGRIADSESYIPWPRTARATFEASAPPRHVMDGYMLGLWTAMRLADVLRLARTRYDGTAFDLKHRKTKSELWVPAFSKLRIYIAENSWPHVLFVTTPEGEKFNESTFGKAFRAHLTAIGLGDYHFHGLRHTTATALADAGATDHEIQSITGHATLQMVQRYTKRANQRRLAARAMEKLERGEPDQRRERTGTEQETDKTSRESDSNGV
jgi:integrase